MSVIFRFPTVLVEFGKAGISLEAAKNILLDDVSGTFHTDEESFQELFVINELTVIQEKLKALVDVMKIQTK